MISVFGSTVLLHSGSLLVTAWKAPFGEEESIFRANLTHWGMQFSLGNWGSLTNTTADFSPDVWVCVFKTIIAELKFETVILITNYSNNFEIGLNWLVMLHLPESFYGKVRKKKKILGGLICLVLLWVLFIISKWFLIPLAQTCSCIGVSGQAPVSPSSARPNPSPGALGSPFQNKALW